MSYFVIEDPAGLHAEGTPLYDALLRSRIAWAKADIGGYADECRAEELSGDYWRLRERMSNAAAEVAT